MSPLGLDVGVEALLLRCVMSTQVSVETRDAALALLGTALTAPHSTVWRHMDGELPEARDAT